MALIAFVMSSCGVAKFKEATYAAREKNKKAFVEKENGEIIEASDAKVRSPLFGKATIELNGEKIPLKEVIAYQDQSAYYRRINGQFAPRIKKGLINMFSVAVNYTEWEQPGRANGGMGGMRNRTKIIYYLQKGDAAPAFRFTPDLTRDYVKDYAPAMEYINLYDQTQKKVKMWSWINTGAVLAGGIIAATAGGNSGGTVREGQLFTGVGLVTAGLINGFVNKARRAKNVKNLEIAIDTYNYQIVKKTR